MYGKNPTHKQHLDPDGLLRVHSVFRTIQGEGPFAGRAAIFVRLWGCNLKCYYCDTEFESVREEYTPDALCSAVSQLVDGDDMCLVVITGGEPFRQNIVPFVEQVVERGYHVQVETSGSLSNPEFPWGDPSVTVVCSPKTGKLHPDMVHVNAWKYIVSARETMDPATGLPHQSTQVLDKVSRICPPMNAAPVYVQPCDVEDPVEQQDNIEHAVALAQRHNYTFSFQIHKAIGVE